MDDAAIRPFEAADEAAVRRLSQRLSEGFASWRDAGKVNDTIASWIDSAVQSGNAAGHALLVAADETEVIGFIAVEVQNHHIDGRDSYIGELAVNEECEGRGVGRKLLASAMEWARSEDASG